MNELPKVGEPARYHPIIGKPHDGKTYKVLAYYNSPAGYVVAKLQGKRGVVCAEAISEVRDANKTPEGNASPGGGVP